MSLRPEDGDRPRWSSTKDPWSTIQDTPGAYPPSPNPELGSYGQTKTITDAVKGRKDEYLCKKTIKVKIGTWNVAAMHDASRDLGGWFAKGLGVKGLTQDLTGLRTASDSDDAQYDSDVEGVEEQEGRVRKRNTTLPKHDSAAVASGDDVDLYVLGLQEVIDVASVTEAMKPYTDPNPAKRWKRALRKHLPQGYKKIVEQQLIGLLLLVFASPKLAPDITSVDSTSVGTGLMGYLGNKGAVSARILLGDATRMLFVNSHLAAGADDAALQRRIWDTQQIVSRTKFAPVGEEWVGGIGRPEGIGDEDIAFWFGDLNYRLDDIPGEDVRRLLLLHSRNEYDILNASKRRIDRELSKTDSVETVNHSKRYEISDVELPAKDSNVEPALDPESDPASLKTTLKSLLTHDQLKAQQRQKKAFYEGWREGDINFLPTYKYDVGSVAMFDSGEKKRSPSWCDRILYRTRLDYDHYQHAAAQEEEAKRRDAEMHKNGLDDAASQEDVLFDYDPDADGDDYDDEVEQHDNDEDFDLVRTKSGLEDAVTLDEYVAHQRVLSSDHKPLTAVFTVTYDSVDPVLKSRVHQQVTKDFDKAENEARPNVTLVLDHYTHGTSVTDKSSEAPDLKLVDFGDVRYHVMNDHHLTIANTGSTEVVWGFVNRPIDVAERSETNTFPSWLQTNVHQELDKSKSGPADMGTSQRYTLQPGEITNIDLVVEITEPEMVKKLNTGEAVIDDILVLRISNGRDYFIPVKGRWLQTCFFRSIDELVRVPSGVRSLSLKDAGIEAQQQPRKNVVHSAPQELFALTDLIPKVVERAVAEWDMLGNDAQPPWKNGQAWPFFDNTSSNSDQELATERLAEIREALDTSTSLDGYLSPTTSSVEMIPLLCETLITFLQSLTDGIITKEVWEIVDSKLKLHEKSKKELSPDVVQDIVMEAVSITPIHSVSFTFVTFMLNRLISEIIADLSQNGQSSAPPNRARSSTSASALSDISLSSVRSDGSEKTRGSFLTSFTRRTTNLSTATSPISLTTPTEESLLTEKMNLAQRYAEIFASVIIRSDDSNMKTKDKKLQLARKVRALRSFLNQGL